MEALRIYFNNFIKLSDNEWSDFEECLTKETIASKTEILRQNEKCGFIAFIEEGSFRFYSIRNGEEVVTAFFFKGDFVTNYRSFLTGKPSDHNIEALKDSVIYKISLQHLQ